MIGGKEHEFIRAAYLFYYASEIAPKESLDMKKEPKIRLNTRISDLLILAKKVYFLGLPSFPITLSDSLRLRKAQL